MDTSQLPIRQHAADILAAVAQNDVVVVIGETGSGKTTQLSQVICLIWEGGRRSHNMFQTASSC
jgi:HrpA-like RNA helicase